MDFAFTDDQRSLRELAGKILSEASAPERLTRLERPGPRFDPDLWADLARAGVLGVAVPEDAGGAGCGFLELCIVLEQAGACVAAVPVLAGLAFGADTVVRLGSPAQRRTYLGPLVAGDSMLTAASYGSVREDGGRLHGSCGLVPAAQLATRVLVRAGGRVHVVDPGAGGVGVEPVAVASREPHARLTLDGCVPEDTLAGTGDTTLPAIAAVCAMQLGVSAAALRATAAYVSQREQFGRPIGSFQAVQQRIADAFIDVEAMRWTAWQAVWRIAEGLDAEREVRIAKFWACEAGARVAATAQQLHGGIGVDLDYPLHRYFLWTKQLELTLGATPVHLEALGATYA